MSMKKYNFQDINMIDYMYIIRLLEKCENFNTQTVFAARFMYESQYYINLNLILRFVLNYAS